MSNHEHAPHNGVPTSIKAAIAIAPKAGSIGARILAYLRGRGDQGATLEEIEINTGISGNTVRPRMKTLRSRGQVVDAGLTRPTMAGNEAIVWKVADAWKFVLNDNQTGVTG